MDQVPYTFLLVDDQTIFLDGIESLLAQLPEVIPFGHRKRSNLLVLCLC